MNHHEGIRCERCERYVHEDYHNTLYVVGIEDLTFELCDVCIDENNLVKIEYDSIDNYSLTNEEIDLIVEGENVYYCEDLALFRRTCIEQYKSWMDQLKEMIDYLKGEDDESN